MNTRFPRSLFFIFLLNAVFGIVSCSDSTKNEDALDPRLSSEKKEMLEYQKEIASMGIKRSSTYIYDCESTDSKTARNLLEDRVFDIEGRMTEKTSYQYSGELKSRAVYVYGPEGHKAYQNLYNGRNVVIQTKYYDQLGYDTLTRNFIENGQVRNEMRKLISLNSEGFPVKIEERDNLGRPHSIITFAYDGETLLEETFTRINAVSGDEAATQVTQYNEHGDRIYMATSTASIIEDEVSMEYVYNEFDKIANARLLNKDGLLIREKANTFYDDGIPRHIWEISLDPIAGDTIQTYEENFNRYGKMLSYYVKGASDNITQSGEYSYDDIQLLEAIEFTQSQTPNYICTFIEYEYYK